MTYISLNYYILAAIALAIYYLVPMNFRWLVLLAADVAFIGFFGLYGLPLILLTTLISYIFARMLDGRKSKAVLWAGIILVIAPWLIVKLVPAAASYLSGSFSNLVSIIAPLGISFYTLQLVAYMVDIYKGRCESEKNFAKHLLFVTYFPQLIQGPIPRYDLRDQLVEGHAFDADRFVRGFYLVIWGFFLKLMIADKLGVMIDTVYNNFPAYAGAYVWLAMAGYMIQLYADFLACTTLARGVSYMFGITLGENFRQPFLAQSISEIWRRWHISLSNWLKDYIYIPLGGNRKGTARKYINIIITFVVSGFWHGTGLNFLVWGLLNGLYQVIGALTNSTRDKIYELLHIPADSEYRKWIKRIGTFLLFSFSFILFRADGLKTGLRMIKSMLVFNPWVLVSDRIFSLGLDGKELVVLAISLVILIVVELKQDKGEIICDSIARQPVVARYILVLAAIAAIIIFGTYGYGFNSQDFIYGGF